MKLAIVAYPSLNEPDRQWVESSRAKHDPQAPRIDAHFTLVFPVEAPPSNLEPEIAAVAQSAQSIPFVIDRISVVPDVLGGGNHIFLVPEEGGVQIATLHDQLYSGVLQGHLRTDIPFTPHMTVGVASDLVAAEELANDVRVQARIIRGTLSSIELVNVGTRRVEQIASFALGDAAA